VLIVAFLVGKELTQMSTIRTSDGTEIHYKDWGEAPAVTLSHGWPLIADAWDGEMLFLAQHGFRYIAHDRRGHGRSSQTSSGNDMNGDADDLAAMIEALDLRDVAELKAVLLEPELLRRTHRLRAGTTHGSRCDRDPGHACYLRRRPPR
jgi:alpha-beta hydrolase superfamily lysophospholipase